MKHQEIIIFSRLSPRLRLISHFSLTPVNYNLLESTEELLLNPWKAAFHPTLPRASHYNKSEGALLPTLHQWSLGTQATTSLATVLHHVGIAYPALVQLLTRVYQHTSCPTSCPCVSRRNQRARRSSSYHKDAHSLTTCTTTQITLISQI